MRLHTLIVVDVAVLASVVMVLIDAADNCSTVTTFNTALTPRVGQYWDRRKLIVDALAAQSTDVLCLQELWYEDDMRDFIANLKTVFPYHYSGLHTKINKLESDEKGLFAKSACSFIELTSLTLHLLPCAIQQGCDSVFKESSEAGLACLAQKCDYVLLNKDAIDPDCLSCLVLSSSSISDAQNRCWRTFGDDLRFNPSGLMILSKNALPLDKTFYSSYFPGKNMVLRRGYIQTEVDGIGKFVCTHLTSVFPHYWEYDLPFSSYEEQNQAEIKTIYNKLQGQPHVLAGDFNTGPAVNSSNPEQNLAGEANQSYSLLQNYSYDTNRYLLDDGRCTYCSDNPLVSHSNNFIDDVLLWKMNFSSVSKKRVLDQNDPPLSDHYGVEAKLC